MLPSVAQRYGARLPRHISQEQVEAVLKAVRTDVQFGRRNYGMILLLARLGLRAPEVIAIQLGDLDWRAGELLVRKGQNHDRVPIPPDVGEALAEYIRHDRVFACRALFVAGRAPHGPFKDGPCWRSGQRNRAVRRPPKTRNTKRSRLATQTSELPAGLPRRRVTFNDRRALDLLLGRITALEARITELNAVLADPELYRRDPARFRNTTEALALAKDELAAAEEQWLRLEMMREQIEGIEPRS